MSVQGCGEVKLLFGALSIMMPPRPLLAGGSSFSAAVGLRIPMILDTLFFTLVLASPIPAVLRLLAAVDGHWRASTADRLVFALAYWCVHLTAVALVLGFAGQLKACPLLLLSAASYLPLLGLIRRPQDRLKLRNILAAMREACLVHRAAVVAGLAVVAAALYRIAAVPTEDYDSMAYHIPFLYEWLLNQRFIVHPQAVPSPIGYYPCHWEALCAVFHIPFRSDLVLLLPNAAALCIWVVSSYGIARRLGAAPRAAQGLSLALATLPIIQFNVLSLHVDLPFAAFFTAAVFFAVRHPDAWNVSMPACAACVGMLCGIKTPGPIYAVGALLVLGIRPEFRRGFFMHLRSRWLLLSVGLVIVFGGAWYFRNLFLTGNPLGILRIGVGPFVLFDGPDETELFPTTLLAVADWRSLSDYGIIWEQILTECGPFWPGLIAVGMLLPILTGLRGSRRDTVFLCLALALCLVLYLVTPYSGDNGARGYRLTSFMGQAIRYAFPLLALLTAAASVGFAGNARADIIAEVAGLALCAGTALTAPPVFVLFLVLACVGAVYPGSALQRVFRGGVPSRLRAAAAAVSLLLAILCVFPWLAAKREGNTPAAWNALYQVFEDLRVTRMAYTRSDAAQLWYGRRLEIRPYPLGWLEPEGYAREMRRLGVRILGVGPIVFPVEQGMRSVADLLASPEFTLIYGTVGTRGPFVFELAHASSKGKEGGRQ